MLGLIYPRSYAEVFEPLTDFEILDSANDYHEQLEYLSGSSKSIWLDLSTETHESGKKVFEHATSVLDILTVIPPHDRESPEQNLRNAIRWRDIAIHQDLIGLWIGEKRHLKSLQDCCELVGLPRWKEGGRPRSIYMNPEDVDSYHLYEFSNLDELRRFRVSSLSTGCPITAAMQGADLSRRERRPKFLCPLKHNMVMNDAQIELALLNIDHIKEAMGDL